MLGHGYVRGDREGLWRVCGCLKDVISISCFRWPGSSLGVNWSWNKG